jgi:hypothetical protein
MTVGVGIFGQRGGIDLMHSSTSLLQHSCRAAEKKTFT